MNSEYMCVCLCMCVADEHVIGRERKMLRNDHKFGETHITTFSEMGNAARWSFRITYRKWLRTKYKETCYTNQIHIWVL